MAFRLRAGKKARSELPRIVSKEFNRTLAALSAVPPDGEAVHDARKRVKKIRAVLRLLQATLGKDYHRHTTRLRIIGHQLAAIRDADAALEIMKAVRTHYPTLVTPAVLAAVRDGLRARKRGTELRSRYERQWTAVRRGARRSAKPLPRRCRPSPRDTGAPSWSQPQQPPGPHP
mgnify:CR=1 FL=1